ncbi:diacylglycerol kinase family protein [Patescibacteria group bacterium]
MIHKISFKHAWEGVVYTFRSQPNMRFHGFFALFVFFSGLFLKISKIEWFVVAFTILLMFTVEMINTSVEAMTDLITQEHRKKAKISKDVSAGMVLVNAIGSVVVGLIIFGPKVFKLIYG